jgi:hypothetical protein
LDINFYYNPNLTTLNPGDLSTVVYNAVEAYDRDTLSNFRSILKFSELSQEIDNSDDAITNNITTLKIHREVHPVYNAESGYTINLGNPIRKTKTPEDSVLSTGFYIADRSEVFYIDDLPDADNIGTLRLFYRNSKGEKVILRDVGTVDYENGILDISDLIITQLYQTSWSFAIRTDSYDVVSKFNQFVIIDFSRISITPIIDTPDRDYKFSSSRV